MPTVIVGNYFLRISFGETDMPVHPSTLNHLYIEQSLNDVVPSVSLSIVDSAGVLTHIRPSDRNSSVITIQVSKGIRDDIRNTYVFDVYRRFPSDKNTISTDYEIMGLLRVSNLFDKSYTRTFTGSLKESIESIATELEIENTEISNSLDIQKTVIQPGWSNAKFLKWLSNEVTGKDDEGSFVFFIGNKNNKKTLFFKSINELINTETKWTFIVNDTGNIDRGTGEDIYPIYSYDINDNYKLYGNFGSSSYSYGYYDYSSGEFKTATVDTSKFVSMSDYFLIGDDDAFDGDPPSTYGRNVDFYGDFKGKAKNTLYKKLMGLVRMNIFCHCDENLLPGDTVKVIFAQSLFYGNVHDYQYNGYWLVENVVHSYGKTFNSRIQLIRNGVDTTAKTTLKQAVTRKK